MISKKSKKLTKIYYRIFSFEIVQPWHYQVLN